MLESIIPPFGRWTLFLLREQPILSELHFRVPRKLHRDHRTERLRKTTFLKCQEKLCPPKGQVFLTVRI